MIVMRSPIALASVFIVVVILAIRFECSRGDSTTTTSSPNAKSNVTSKITTATTPKTYITSSPLFAAESNEMSLLDNLKKESVIPDVIDTQPSASIDISYDSGVTVEQGKELTPTKVKDLPKFTLPPGKDGELYLLTMVDPDAPSRKDPKFREILHFMVANIPGNHVEKGDTLAEYIGAGAPQGTGLHRYIFLLYKQKGPLKLDMKIPKNSRNGRVGFSIRKFAKEHDLGEPVAANFFQAQYDDYVPTLHAQLASGSG